MLCRKDTSQDDPGRRGRPAWQVMFFGYISPGSVKFNRGVRTCTFTAYAPGKLLEAGNAERIHRFNPLALPLYGPPARPFVILVDTAAGTGAIQHPAPPSGIALDADGNPIAGANDWWRIYNGATAAIPLLAGDQFQVVRAVPVGSWTEGMATVTLGNATFTTKAVVAVGAHLYIQTLEAPTDAALGLFGYTASIELLNPWYRSRDWKALIDGSDGNANCLEAEVNEALALLGVSDVVNFVVADSPTLPLLPVTEQLFAQPIYQPDVVPGCVGVSYGLYSGTPFLSHQRGGIRVAVSSPVTAKPDILKADSVAAPFSSFPRAAANLYNPTPIAGYVNPGPDDGFPVRLLSSSINDQLDAAAAPDYASNNLPIGGQDLHQFNASEVNTESRYDSTHFCRAPSTYRAGTPMVYRLHARGRWVPGPNVFHKGIQITQLTTADEGATWTIAATAGNISSSSYPFPEPGNACPFSSPSSRPSIKVFELGAGAFLYVWTDPIKEEVYSHEAATDDITPVTLLAETAFIAGGAVNSPKLSSSAVHWPDGTTSGTTLFFSERDDGGGVDVWYYAPGPTWTLATIVDSTGLGIPMNLVGADWINAVADSSRSPVRLYVMVGSILYAMQVAFSSGTLTISEAQAVPIDQVNYDQAAEQNAIGNVTLTNPGAIAWLTCPVTQAPATGEPDYTAASDALIIGTVNAGYILSNVAANIVDIADFEGLSVAAALAEMITLRAYFLLSASDQDLVVDPDTYVPIPTVSFYARLETAARAIVHGHGVVDLTDATEQIEAGTWLQLYQSVQVSNSKASIGPAYSATGLTNLDGKTFTINPLRNAASAALQIDNPFVSTVSFCQLLANLFAQEFVIPRPSATLVIRGPYSRGQGFNLYPGMLVEYLLRPPDSINAALTQQGRVLTVDYALDTGLEILGVA
jgi:hypothetical protein